MKLHKVGKSKSPLIKAQAEKPKKERKSHKNSLPSEEYTPLFEPIRFQVNEYESYSGDSIVKDYLEISVKRFGEDDENAPRVFMQMYRESPKYTGYIKKSINFPINEIEEVIDALDEVRVLIDKHDIKPHE